MKRIGILTGGGDCPGLNSVIRAVVRRGLAAGFDLIGIKNGWTGLCENETVPLTVEAVSGILHKGGTILGTSRTNPFKDPTLAARLTANLKALNLTGLIAVGGEDTLGIAARLAASGWPVVGVPKTIDNDLNATDYTFGFDTAVNIAMEAIDRLHTTAESHHRIMVVETMGRHAGWIAVHAGMAGGADIILIPEIPIDLNEVCTYLDQRHQRGKPFSIVVVAEGAKFTEGDLVTQETRVDAFGHPRLGGIGQILAEQIEKRTGLETRVTTLGHVLRGGSPSAFDRVLATRFGVSAVDLVVTGQFGRMVSLRGNRIVSAPLAEAVNTLKTVDQEFYNVAKVFFG